MDRLRALGNAVVPDQAELAFLTLWPRIFEEVVVNDPKPGFVKCETCGVEKEKGDRQHIHCQGCGRLKGQGHTMECPKSGLVDGVTACFRHKKLLGAGAPCRACREEKGAAA